MTVKPRERHDAEASSGSIRDSLQGWQGVVSALVPGENVLRELSLLPHFPDDLVHLEAGEPLDIARQIDPGLDAAGAIGLLEGRPILGQLLLRLGLRLHADVEVACAARAAQADRDLGRRRAGL